MTHGVAGRFATVPAPLRLSPVCGEPEGVGQHVNWLALSALGGWPVFPAQDGRGECQRARYRPLLPLPSGGFDRPFERPVDRPVEHPCDGPVGRLVRARAPGHPGWRELTCPGLQRGGRHAPVHGLRRGRLAARRRRQRVRRPDLLVGTTPARACPPRGPGSRGRGSVPRYVVRHPDPAGGRARRGDRAPHVGGAGPVRLLGHRGHHVGDPARPRLHRPRSRGEVRRLLPRPRRLTARRGGLRAGHPPGRGVRARHSGCPRRLHGRDPGAALQRPRGRRGRVRRARSRDRLPDHRGIARQHGRGPAAAGLQPVPVRDLREAWRAVRLRRGDDRVPGLASRSVGSRRSRRGLDSRPGHLRQGDGRWLPGCGVRRPGRRDGDAVARTGRSTRQARSRGTRSRPPPVWPRCGWRPRTSTRTSTPRPARSRPRSARS